MEYEVCKLRVLYSRVSEAWCKLLRDRLVCMRCMRVAYGYEASCACRTLLITTSLCLLNAQEYRNVQQPRRFRSSHGSKPLTRSDPVLRRLICSVDEQRIWVYDVWHSHAAAICLSGELRCRHDVGLFIGRHRSTSSCRRASKRCSSRVLWTRLRYVLIVSVGLGQAQPLARTTRTTDLAAVQSLASSSRKWPPRLANL